MERGTVELPNAADLAKVAAPAIPPNQPAQLLGVPPRYRLSVIPERIVPSWLPPRPGAAAVSTLGALAMHAGFAALFVLLLDWRDFPAQTERAIPIEIVAAMPVVPKPLLPPPAPSPPPPPPPPPPAAELPPALLAPPPEPPPAAPEASSIASADVEPRANGQKTVSQPGPPPETPAVISAPHGNFSVPLPAPDVEKARPKATAKSAPSLADVLPMDLSVLPPTFRAVLSGSGAQNGTAYKGLVYGRIQRSHRAMEEAAARHLRGQVVVAFSVDPDGRAGDLRVAKSSGNSTVDALGLEMVREAEPFPAPPPGARQVFTPAFAFGQEE